jgi:xanthine dehydrogenase accessory factor
VGALPYRWLDALAAAFERHPRAVLVTVADTRGSAPRESGAAMVVATDAIGGTIGGGHLEYESIRLAREALASGDATPAATWLVRFPLAARLGQCCGGVATLAFQTIARDDAEWLATARACERTQASFALIAAIGSGTHAAARLVVTADDARGTLGDRDTDSIAIAAARARLDARIPQRTGATGLVSAGAQTLLIHATLATGFDVLVFGNGHVGRALVQVLAALPARVLWIDERETDFPNTVPPNVEVIATDTPDAELRAAPFGSYVAIMTHNHALDFDLALAALARNDWRYVGMIGSRSKRVQFERRAAERGYTPENCARITSPIGAVQWSTAALRTSTFAFGAAPQSHAPIRSKEPGAIAVAIAAEMLIHRERAEDTRDAQRDPETTLRAAGATFPEKRG